MKSLREVTNPLGFQKVAKKIANKAMSASIKKAPDNVAMLKVKAMKKAFPGKLGEAEGVVNNTVAKTTKIKSAPKYNKGGWRKKMFSEGNE